MLRKLNIFSISFLLFYQGKPYSYANTSNNNYLGDRYHYFLIKNENPSKIIRTNPDGSQDVIVLSIGDIGNHVMSKNPSHGALRSIFEQKSSKKRDDYENYIIKPGLPGGSWYCFNCGTNGKITSQISKIRGLYKKINENLLDENAENTIKRAVIRLSNLKGLEQLKESLIEDYKKDIQKKLKITKTLLKITARNRKKTAIIMVLLEAHQNRPEHRNHIRASRLRYNG